MKTTEENLEWEAIMIKAAGAQSEGGKDGFRWEKNQVSMSEIHIVINANWKS